jgi:hypothetical protein
MTGDRSIWESPPPCARVRARARVGREGTAHPSPVTQVWKSASAIPPGPFSRVTDAWPYPSLEGIRHPQATLAAPASVIAADATSAGISCEGAGKAVEERTRG